VEGELQADKFKFKFDFWSLGLVALVCFGFFASLFNIENGVRGEYYAAVVKSMSLNASNFFFGAFDPSGAISLDKIPGSFWLPAIFVKIFGFSTWSLEAPNALATIAASVIVAVAVRRVSSAKAGILAGLIIASTPILVAVTRTNHPEAIFVFMLACVALAATTAFKTQKLSRLIFLGLWVALAFDCYMLEAWAIWPAIAVAWLFTERTMGKKLLDILISGIVSLGASILWPVIVSLVPATNRPYIGGTLHNNPFEMIFGYNGLGRFGLTAGFAQGQYKTYVPEFAGHPGITRMFNHHLAGQIAWLLPAAVVSIIVLLLLKRLKPIMIFFAAWFACLYVMFSTVAGMHQFYTSALAIPAAALIGVGLFESRRAGSRLGLVAIVASAGITAVFIERYYGHYHRNIEFLQFGLAMLACLLILLRGRLLGSFKWVSRFVTPSVAVAGLLLTPVFWSLDAQNHVLPMNPVAGVVAPARVLGALDKPAYKKVSQQTNLDAPKQAMLDYLTAHQDGRRFAFATLGGLTAAPLITRTNLSILPIGGFNGSDAFPSLSQFKQLIARGELRYVIQIHSEMVLAAKINGLKDLAPNLRSIEEWVMANCTAQHYLPAAWHIRHGAKIYECLAAQ